MLNNAKSKIKYPKIKFTATCSLHMYIYEKNFLKMV